MYLDARLISGVSDGSTVQTWSDSSGSANDVTQATAGNRPTYKTGIIGGQPTMRFLATSVNWYRNSSYTITSNSVVVLMVAKPATTITNGSGRFVGMNLNASSDGNNLNSWLCMYYDSSTNKIGSYRNGSAILSASTMTRNTPYVVSIQLNGTAVDAYILSVKTSGTTSATSMNSNHLMIGADESGPSGSALDADISYVSVIKSNINDSLRKRLEHSMGFSYKISTN